MFKNPFRKDDKSINSVDFSKIFPILKSVDRSSVSMDVIEMPISIPLIDNLHIHFAIDKDDHLAYLNESTLGKTGYNIEQIKTISNENFKSYVNRIGISIEGDDNLQMIKLDQVMESSLILYDELWTKLCIDYDDDIVIALPSREILLISLASNRTGIAQLKQGVLDLYSSGQYKLSNNLYLKRLDGTFKRLSSTDNTAR